VDFDDEQTDFRISAPVIIVTETLNAAPAALNGPAGNPTIVAL
jgi:hypothetical protein